MWGPAQVAGAAAFNTRHRDLNVCRTIVTYAGPGTHVAHEVSILHISTTTYFPPHSTGLLFSTWRTRTVWRAGTTAASMQPTRTERCSWHPSTVQMPWLAAPCGWSLTAPEARPLARGGPLGPRRELAAWQPKRGCGGTLVPATRRQCHRLWPPGAWRRAPHEGWALGAGIAWRRRGAPRARDWARAHLHCAPAHAQGGRVRRLLKPEQVVCQVAKAVARGLPNQSATGTAHCHWPQCAANET